MRKDLTQRRALLVAAIVGALGTVILGSFPAVAVTSPGPATGSPTTPPPTVAPLAPATWPAGATPPPAVAVATWLVADLDTGAVLGAQGEHIPLPPASTIKTLTALTLLPHLDKQDTYTATYADAAVEGSRVGLFEGGVYTVDQLFQGLFLQSGNDTAHALGELGGGQAQTARAMNAVAAELGATDTHAVNTSGLDDAGQVSTAFDLAVIARAGLARKDFSAYAGLLEVDFPGRDGATYKIHNQNPLLDRYPGALGIKTGYTTQAGRTFVGAAERSGHRLVVTFMNTKSPTVEVASALLDWGFAVRDTSRPVGNLADKPAEPDASQTGPAAGGPDTPALASPDIAQAAGAGTAAAGSVDDPWLPTWAWVLGAGGAALLAASAGGILHVRRSRPRQPPQADA